ncbi:hypothetical protein LSTR_LSTR015337 [Laodelphax striatellus]|uniref:Protein TsetseEP domain-containing protein n=1 Tax=Laodelphax striatellus TaxID=195883 RepID=A0A482WU81_LAOST|nr:hypothetical protein LSTR_LSTR015337 [Laodelphax striatellus]
MHCSAIILVTLCLGLLGKAFGSRNVESFHSYPSHESNLQSQKSVEHLPIQNIDDLLNKMDENYSSINKEIDIIVDTYGKTLDEFHVDCTSARVAELIAEKENFDYCHNLTVQIKELKNLTGHSLNLLFDIGYATSIIVANGIECHHSINPLAQLNCYFSLYRYTRSFLIENFPKIMKIADEVKVMTTILTVDSFNCFFNHSIDQETAKEIALINLKC